MYQLLGLALFVIVIFGVTAIVGLVSNWFLVLPFAALAVVIVAAVWFSASKRKS